MLGVLWTLTAALLDDQHAELVNFYTSTGGESWTRNDQWLQGDDYCTWEGVVCGPDGNVTQLLFVNNNLNGSYSGSWDVFEDLEHLDLSKNALLEGDIGSHLRSLPSKLEAAFLHDCIFDGSIAFSDDLCANRTTGSSVKISASNNRITSLSAAVPSCVNSLDVSQNPSADGVPIIENATMLATLLMQGCNATAPSGWLSSWCEVPLTQIDISDNEFLQGSTDDLCFPKSLKSLVISNTMLTGDLPTTIYELDQLGVLKFSGNFEGILLDGFKNLKQLTSLYLSGNFTGPLPGSIFSGPIQDITIEHTLLTGTLPTGVFADINLSSLILDNNKLEGTIPSDVWTNVKEFITLSNNNFVGTIPVELENPPPTLMLVQIRNNKLSGFVPDFYNNSMIPWMGFEPTRKTFFSGLDLLSPVPDWVRALGAGPGRLLTINEITPKLVPSDVDSVVSMSGDLVWLPPSTLRIGMCIVTNTTTCNLPASPDYFILNLTSVTDQLYQFTVPARVDNYTGPFVMNIYYAPEGELPAVINNFTFPATGITYNQYPVVTESIPRAVRPQGCWAVTVVGSDFSDTLDSLKCKIGNNYTRATFVNSSAVICHIPQHSTTPVMNETHEVVVTPNDGLTHSDPTPNALLEYKKSCPVSYMIDRNCDDGCGLCECSGDDQGTCVNDPLSPDPPFCKCKAGFRGHACDECAEHHFGDFCLKCSSCDQGTCNAGKTGDGKCHCSRLYSGEKCDKLALGVIFALVITAIFFVGACAYGYKQWKVRSDYEGESGGSDDEQTPFIQEKKPDVALEDVSGAAMVDDGGSNSINAAPVDHCAE